MLSTNKGMYVKVPSLKGLCESNVKTATYLCNRFNSSFCARDDKTNQAISNLN